MAELWSTLHYSVSFIGYPQERPMRPVGGSTPLKLSNDWHDFKAKLDRHYPPLSWITQLAMDLDHQRDREWIHEIKHDGLRLMVRRNGAGIRLFTSDFSAYADRSVGDP